MFDFNDYMLDIVLSKVKKTIDIRKFDNTKILINTDDEMLNYFTLKKFATWIICVIKDHGKFHPQIFLEKALFVNEATKFYALLLCSHYFFNTHLSCLRFPPLISGNYNPEQNLLKQKLSPANSRNDPIFEIANSLPYPSPLYQCWIWPSFVVTSLKLWEQHWFWGRWVFSLTNRFSVLSQQFCPRL